MPRREVKARPSSVRPWPVIPKAWAIEPTCVVCGCTENAACVGGCGWEALNGRNRGFCSRCNEKLCSAAAMSIIGRLEDQDPDRGFVPDCPCPSCTYERRRAKR